MDNLARDAARALAEGKTYGKWKAEHPKTRDDEFEIEDTAAKRCDVCGRPIKEGHYRKRCSPECSKIANQRRNSQRKKEREIE